ncbi:MAG: sensor histidine kinase [Nitrospirae bacterium]|nr:sensor histidine kinase [Nitrospirota bacterium]
MAVPMNVTERIERKKADYQRYDFTRVENDALKTFFDLAQEFDGIEDFYRLCVAIPASFFDLDARLYITDPKLNALSLMATTEDEADALHAPAPSHIRPNDSPYYSEQDSLVLTIRGKKLSIDKLPFHIEEDVIGLLEVFPVKSRDIHTELFFEKYANRIGFRMHNKFLVERNAEHLRFIRSLVADIEHNIIVPNMVYKLFLRRLRAKVMMNKEIERMLAERLAGLKFDKEGMEEVVKELSDVNSGLSGDLENIEKHYRNMSLFIETLFRKSHFDQGRLTLRTKPCNMKKDVVQPQLERYIEQFQRAGIMIDDRLSGIPEEEVITVVDVGLIAQVYANLFSNALKYTDEVDIFGGKKKYMAYGHEVMKDFFGPGRDGIKYNVFSSGPHILPQERERLFQEEFRGSNASDRPGTGHGLAFIKNAVEIHGGVAGYEPTDYGNNFYFILPR